MLGKNNSALWHKGKLVSKRWPLYIGTSIPSAYLQRSTMLKCATSLWSADLANLAADIRRVAPYSERFHLDVADGHYAPTMLFFPDLVAALRPHTDRPFEMHLMTTDPAAWIDPFAEAGADAIIICFDSAADPGCRAGGDQSKGTSGRGLALAGRGSRFARSLLDATRCVDAAEHGCRDQGSRYGPAGTR